MKNPKKPLVQVTPTGLFIGADTPEELIIELIKIVENPTPLKNLLAKLELEQKNDNPIPKNGTLVANYYFVENVK